MQQFYKGRTNNHLTWVMVDATDFATPESALSAATKIKIYGKVRGATGVNFVSSGAGSLTNDIQHVGASALGIYTIALAKADLSDASNAWYDQYIVSLSATGAAYQTLVVDGGIDASAISGYQSRLSDILSQVLLATSAASDAASAATQANSRVLLVLSNVSDVQSALTVVQSMASDAASAAAQGNSRTLLVQSRLSDLDSRLASDVSDLLSQTLLATSAASDAASAAQQANSRVLVVQSRLSDLDSRLASDVSDLLSQTLLATSAASDAASAAQQANSRVLLNQSRVSDIYSLLTAGVDVGASSLSDITSAVWAVARAEPTAVVSPTGTMKTGIEWLVALSRNKVTQTATVQSLRNDADSADIASAAVSDDGTTFTRGEFA